MRKEGLKCISELAMKDERIVFLGSDLGPDVLQDLKKERPEQFFMEGVSESNIVGMAAGFALDGHRVFINTIGTFLTRRCLDQIIIDLAYENLPVRLYAYGGGLVYGPLGPTHIAFDDLALMNAIPNMTILVPSDALQMNKLIKQTEDLPGPVYIRCAKGGDKAVTTEMNSKLGFADLYRDRECERKDVLFISTGIMLQRCLDAIDLLTENDVQASCLNFHTIKPFDNKKLVEVASNYSKIITVEEHLASAGLGAIVARELLLSGKFQGEFKTLGIPDEFPDDYGRQENFLDLYKLNPKDLCEVAIKMVKND